ncbi:lytic transglycosylase domain-containing protein [Kalamiella sp. sgz302252]|uniref:lytic transglycosylase domain-containing protein n=1 Tax=Pantoea sp. sgz302252 TaxID=3341827 RepID=UPI0036D2D05E
MLSVSSGHPFSPLLADPGSEQLRQQQNTAGSLNEKTGSAISFAQSGSQGTSLESLLGNDSQQQQNSDLSQLVSEILKAVLPLIQQLLQGQQASGGENNASGTGGGNTPVNFGQASAENGAAQTPEIPVLSAAQTQNAGATSGSSTALSVGSSDLHLPDSLKPYEADIQDAAQATGVPANVLAAQIWQESRGNLGAATVNGGNGLQDAGLMQVNSNTFADLQSKNPDLLGVNASPNNAHDNIMAGALYMKEQLGAFDGSMGAALRAYNSGPNNVNTNDLSDISKTGTGDATYVDKVMDFANTIATGKGTLPA